MTDHVPRPADRQLFEAAGVPMLLVDPEVGQIVDANDAALQLYVRTRDELVGHAVSVITRSSPERLRDALATSAARERTFALDHFTGDGRELPVILTASPVVVDGRRLLLVVVAERSPDIDARAALALLYEASSDLHRAMMRAGSEVELWSEVSRIIVEVAGFPLAWVALRSDDGRSAHVAASAGAVDYLADRLDDLTAATPTPVAVALNEVRTIVFDDLRDEAVGPYRRRALAFGFRSGAVVPLRAVDGVAFGALVVLDNRPTTLSGERIDMLERLAEDVAVARSLLLSAQRLRASEARYRSMVEQASAGIMVFDVDGAVLDANPAACAMVGYSLEELRALGPSLVLPDLTPDEEAGLRDVLDSGAAMWVDRRFRCANGDVITVAFQGRRREDGTLEAVIQDVTAQRSAEAALRASEARYRDLVRVLQEGIITYDAEGRVTEMNEAAARLHRSIPGQLIGSEARHIARTFIREDGSPWPPEDLPTQVALRTGAPTDRMVIGVPQADGPVRWLSSNAVPTGLRADGRPSGVVVSFADVTDLREAIARATASEDRVRRLVDEAFDGVIVTDPTGEISYANPASARMLGLAPGALHGRSMREVVPPAYHERLASDLASIAAGRVFEGEYPALRADGAELAIEVTGSLLADGRIEVIARNVTARKALEAERDRLAQAADQASDAIYITDADGTISYVNRAYERMNGYLREEVVGRTADIHLAPEQAGLEDHISAALAASGSWAGEAAHRAKDGTRFRVSSRVVALRDGGGRVTGRVAIARDITIEREQDARVAQAARLDAVAQLAGGVAHELNNLLTMIVGHATLLDPFTATPTDISEGVRAITDAAGQAETLTTRMLAFGRRAFLQPRPADLRSLLVDTQPLLARAAGHRVALVVSPGSTAMPVHLDPNMFEQALLALVVHARDTMPDGGTIRLAIERPQQGETLPGSEAAVLIVSDTSPGLAPGALSRLFEPFAAIGADEPGLALAMAHGFVEQSGGRVDVTSAPGHGTTFRILLPLAAPEAETARPAAERQPERTGPATILVADDEPVLLQVAARTLKSRGYTVLLASSGDEALKLAMDHEGRIDLLFTDVVMPGLRGPGLAAALLRSRPDMKVLLTSGYAEDIVGRRGIESTVGEFLPKPFTPSMLAATVESLLSADAR